MSRLWCSISPTSNSEISWLTCILLHFETSIVALHYVTLHVEVQPGIHVLIYVTGASKHPWTQAQIQEVLSGGVGWVFKDQRPPKNSLDNVFLVLSLFYSLQRLSNGFIAERTILSKGSRGGPTFSSEVQLFPGGVGGGVGESKC